MRKYPHRNTQQEEQCAHTVEGAVVCQVAFEIPSEVLYDTRMSNRDAIAFARRATALLFYSSRGVSLGYCAQIADMDKEDFIYFLGENGVSIFHFDSEEEFIEEMNNA